MIIKTVFFAVLLLAVTICTNCETSECGDCGGGIIDGHLYKRVTTDDLVQLSPYFQNLAVDDCIRFKLDLNDDFDIESVEQVDDCCCDIY